MKSLCVAGNSRGFIRLIILLIVILVIASLLGFSPQYVWTNYLAPIFGFIWRLIVAFAGFLVKLLKAAGEAFDYLLDLIKN
ncbi:MAG TPA: hypothetical protein P5328_00975 [Candidatus Paceibacterota bacterium]|nr:hypothetical protein [Candidatus Paceibacterota bacterium]HRZ34563.1 hypothetical protein [Candidatus Paceibacterota bacterium]